ncbi:uncharacterized protein VICG_01069 [Vittaforma corneae ATCC 50505]|uniref:E3 ubiquitin protein ligase n=1 Tax=Vittaforma corneae (strain ATCC 50505) TaxID=993615 RepID=L2GN05_VITCO|nr:uncharacterized protein VICG_01069 [Vittaforma corneae ATCC 50505]ELA41885.1 hypothetical protein VICG_01069 [Vittaforma corneae ATCC 50505]
MAKSSRLHDKRFKKKFKECILQLETMLSTNGIYSKQKILLSNLLEDLRTQPMLDSENSSNVEVKNMWGQKDLQTVLKERNDRIYNLENELEEMRSMNSKLSEERKRIKTSVLNSNGSETLEKIIETKNKELFKVSSELEGCKSKIKDLENQLQIQKESCNILKDSNKRLSDITNKRSPPLINRDFLLDIQKSIDSEQELIKFKTLNAELERELSVLQEKNNVLEQRIEALTQLISDYESKIRIRGTTEKLVNTNDTENALMEELENITTAYDQILAANKKLEESLSESLRNASEHRTENINLKCKIKALEDSKQYVEREKRRLGEWKDTLLNETRSLEEKITNFDIQSCEKDRKINDYKVLLTTLQSNIRILENEVNTINIAYRQAQSELFEIKSDIRALQVEYGDIKRICETYKGLCTADIDIIEEVERYKKVLRCSLCDTNIKNSVISKCMHTFCDSCLNSRLKARQRKCPSCQIEFNSNDVKKVYF